MPRKNPEKTWTVSDLGGFWRAVSGDGIHGYSPHILSIAVSDGAVIVETWLHADEKPDDREARVDSTRCAASIEGGEIILTWVNESGKSRAWALSPEGKNSFWRRLLNTTAGMVRYRRMKKFDRSRAAAVVR